MDGVKFKNHNVLIVPLRVIIISAVRVYLVVEGQWRPDSSWNYNPMLAIENAEISGTLIALSIPGLKPLFDRFFSKVGHLQHPNRSHPPSFNALNPSAMFGSEASKTSVVVDDRPMQEQPHPLSNPWGGLGYGVQFRPPSYASSTSSSSTTGSTTESTNVADEVAPEHGTAPPNPWGRSPAHLTSGGTSNA